MNGVNATKWLGLTLISALTGCVGYTAGPTNGAIAGARTVGVSFFRNETLEPRLVVAVNRTLRQRGWFADQTEPNLLQWLDLVALGTVCDVVPLTGLNRVLVAQGLKVAAAQKNPGLAALGEIAKVNERPSTYHLGFVFGPRLNAGGRVGGSRLGTMLLSTDDMDEARAIAAKLNDFNTERREIEAAIQSQAVEQVESKGDGDPPFLFLSDRRWHQGVVGIVASRLKDRFNRPAIVIAIDGDVGKGSGRSIAGVDLGAAVTAAKQAGLLLAGGGHAMAAGLTLERDAFIRFSRLFEAEVTSRIESHVLEHVIPTDGELKAQDFSLQLAYELNRIVPWGQGFPEPRFSGHFQIENRRIVGNNHVRLVLAPIVGGGTIQGIAFGAADEPWSMEANSIMAVYKLDINNYRGNETLQLVIDYAKAI